MSVKLTLLVDFDGVLHNYHGFVNAPLDLPVPKSRAAMYKLAQTFRLVCFTARDKELVEIWLRNYGFPKMKVTNRKEPAHLIIDDRCMLFSGVWSDEYITRITSFTPHWEQHAPSPTVQDSQPSHHDMQYPFEFGESVVEVL